MIRTCQQVHTNETRVITVKEIRIAIDRLHAVTENMNELSKDYLPWPSTVTSVAVTETLVTAIDIDITSPHTSLR